MQADFVTTLFALTMVQYLQGFLKLAHAVLQALLRDFKPLNDVIWGADLLLQLHNLHAATWNLTQQHWWPHPYIYFPAVHGSPSWASLSILRSSERALPATQTVSAGLVA